MRATIRSRARGVTLIELLVVLMILSIVLTAAVRTWDVTLERGRAVTTSRKLDQLVTAIGGDPDYIVAGQRADFGFVGDIGRLPNSLRELVVSPPGATLWRGPYLRSTFSESFDAFRIDGWGDTIIYGYEAYGNNHDSLFVRSYGGRGFVDKTRWQTVSLPYSYDALMTNQIDGNIVDVRGNAPRDPAAIQKLKVILIKPFEGNPDSSVFYTGTQAASFVFPGIAQGTMRLVAMYIDLSHVPPGETVATTMQNVPVYPGIGAHSVMMRLPLDWDHLP